MMWEELENYQWESFLNDNFRSPIAANIFYMFAPRALKKQRIDLSLSTPRCVWLQKTPYAANDFDWWLFCYCAGNFTPDNDNNPIRLVQA